MAEILETLRVMPENVDVDIEALAEDLKNVKSGRFNSMEKEPIGFGIVAIKASYVVPEKDGATDALVEEVKRIKGVGEVEVIASNRLL